jgi:hypothetical protein
MVPIPRIASVSTTCSEHSTLAMSPYLRGKMKRLPKALCGRRLGLELLESRRMLDGILESALGAAAHCDFGQMPAVV